jgi:hypothetical protein
VVTVRHPDQLWWPDVGLTKRDAIEYCEAIAPVLLPHLRNRPLTLKRHYNGPRSLFEWIKDAPPELPEWSPVSPQPAKSRAALPSATCWPTPSTRSSGSSTSGASTSTSGRRESTGRIAPSNGTAAGSRSAARRAVLFAACTGRARRDARGVGGARGGNRPGRVHPGRRARADREARRPLRAGAESTPTPGFDQVTAEGLCARAQG